MKNLNEKGITLIALIITIIVLLILAGITINLTIGEGGIIKRAEEAGKNYTNAADYEKYQLAEFLNETDKILANVAEGGGTGDSTPKNPTLTSQITGEDYGKNINYSVTVEETELSNWRVFYNDGSSIYIILDGYLDNSLIPDEIGMAKEGKYIAYWTNVSDNAEAVETLTNTTYWSAFAAGKNGAKAMGCPTNEMFVNSWNNNVAVNSTKLQARDYSK